jgi:DNA-binding GntR family transcriptional regulator
VPDLNKPQHIADRIVDAILARKLAPGARLGEQPLADLFGVSRTIVREALARLAARGMVEVNSRRGWFVVQPSLEDARDAFAARQVIETGLLQSAAGRIDGAALKRLQKHVTNAASCSATSTCASPSARATRRSPRSCGTSPPAPR